MEEEKQPGAPATYGPDIGTALSIQVAARAGLDEPARRARTWLGNRKPDSVLTAAGILETARAETVDVAGWVRLTVGLSQMPRAS